MFIKLSLNESNQYKIIYHIAVICIAMAKTSKPKKRTIPPKKGEYKMLWIIFLIGSLSIWGYLVYRWNADRYVKFDYTDFEILVPITYTVHGIDVSRYQENLNWNYIKAAKNKNISIKFAFIKATEGLLDTDPYFSRNWIESQKIGIARGAYHFFIPGRNAKIQAQNFINRVKLRKGDLPPVLDVEASYGANINTIKSGVKEWLDIIEKHYKVRPIIYTNIEFYNSKLGVDFYDYPLWIAHYKQLNQPRISRDWLFWQHSESGQIKGIKSKLDFNVFNGDSTEFSEILLK